MAPADVAAALSAAEPRSRWRMEVDRRADGVTVVNDAYNANPESMRAALAALAGLAGRRGGSPSSAAMAELGPDAAAEHERLGRDAAAAGVDLIVAVGPDAVGIAEGAAAAGRRAGEESVHVPDRAAARELLSEVLRPGDVVLVKASRSYGLELLAADLLTAGAARVRSVLIAAGFGLIISILLTPLAIRAFRRQGLGQEIRDDGPESHLSKQGTPTMGGTVIVGATVGGYLAAHLFLTDQPGWGFTATGLLLLFLMVGMGTVGFLDDYLKIRHRRSLGLNKTAKLVGQLVVGVAFAVLAINFPNARRASRRRRRSSPTSATSRRSRSAPIGFVILAYLFIAGFSNAVNLTDGLDGLAAGSSAMVFASYVFISFWQFTHDCANELIEGCYTVRDPLDVTLRGGRRPGRLPRLPVVEHQPGPDLHGRHRLAGAGRRCSSGLAIVTRTELLLVVLGGLFVAVTLSVVIQVGVLPRHPAAGVPDGAAAPPLRARRLDREHRHRPVLAGHRRWPSPSASGCSTPTGSTSSGCDVPS